MNALTIALLLLIAALIGYDAWPTVTRWWHTKRPTQCPACHAWRPVADMTYIRHNSGAHVRVCEDCCRNLYAPFSSGKRIDKDKTQ